MAVPPDPQAEVVGFLSDPGTYGLPRGAVQRVETHASIVFLAGDDVFKLKKPVAFAYMDFSTLEKRRRNCEAEVALNRRTAPELYLGVRAVRRGAGDRLSLSGPGEPVEWLVHMRRFDPETVLDRLAEHGGLDADLARALADAIAEFHAKAEQRPSFGGPDAMRRVVENNDRELRGLPPRIGAQAEVESLRDACLALIARDAGLLARRRDAGYVRRCHGDLHLANICTIAGRPVLFDALEFDEALASIDVLYDLGFLLMDLCHRRLGDIANVVLNRYAMRQGPADLDAFCAGLRLLPLFLATRAAVRAHVTGRTGGEAAPERVAGYLDLALGFLAPVPPRLLAVGGLSGSGKSTATASVAPGLGPAPGALVLRTDALRKAEFGLAPEQRLPASGYEPAVSARIYARLLACAERALRAGHSVILDGVFARPAERADAAALAARCGVPFRGFWLDVPESIMRQRLAGRRGDVSDATPATLAIQLGYDLGAMEWSRIDASGTAAQTAARIAHGLGEGVQTGPECRPAAARGRAEA